MMSSLVAVLVSLAPLNLKAVRIREIREVAGLKCDTSALLSCEQLTHSGVVGVETIANHLDIKIATAASIFGAIGTEGKDLKCEAFCTSLVEHAPAILHATVPSKPDRACLDPQCTKEIDVSDEFLRKNRFREARQRKKEQHKPYAHALALGVSRKKNQRQKQQREKQQRHAEEVSGSHTSVPGFVEDDVARGVRQLLNMYFSLYPAPAEDENMGLPTLGPKISSRARLREKIIEASLKAAAWTASALRKIHSENKDTAGRLRNFIRKWFGKHHDTQSVKLYVLRLLSGTNKVLTNMIIRKGGGRLDRFQQEPCDPGVYAYVYPGQVHHSAGESRYVVNLCDFTLESDDWVILGGTLVHEASHHIGTSDWQYGLEGCEELAKHKPMYAIDNADNLEYFVDDLVANWKRGSPKTWLPRLKDNEGNRWTPGEEVKVRDRPDLEWQNATVVGLKHGVLVVHIDGTERNAWRFADEVQRPLASKSCEAATMGEVILVKDMERHEWKDAIVADVDDEGDLIANLLEPEKPKSRRHQRDPRMGWRYCKRIQEEEEKLEEGAEEDR